MSRTFKLGAALAVLAMAAIPVFAGKFTAPTNYLNSVTVFFSGYYQQSVNTNAGGGSVVGTFGVKTADVIRAVTGSYQNGDLLVRNVPIENVVEYSTNLTPTGSNYTVSITNTSTTNINYTLYTNGTAVGAISNTDLVFSATTLIGANPVALGTSTVTYGTNTNNVITVGTNTTVTATPALNGASEVVGTNYVFVSNTTNVVSSSTNKTGTATWCIRGKKGVLTPITTNNYIAITTPDIYDTTNLANFHGEKIKSNGVIEFGTTDELRVFSLSNSDWNIQLRGFASGRDVIIALTNTGTSTITAHNYNWTGNGSGTTNSTPVILDGTISEQVIVP